MEISVRKLTDEQLMRRACEMTWKGHGKQSKMTLAKMYDCEHSPMRTQLFWVEMRGVLSFVSVHFVRHKIGVEHFVESNREDRGGSGSVDRQTPVNHGMLVNAQALINMARKRLCCKAHKETRETMGEIKEAVRQVDPDLAEFMVPECKYRRGCHEPKSCGWWERQLDQQGNPR
jgi:hypothetical protein